MGFPLLSSKITRQSGYWLQPQNEPLLPLCFLKCPLRHLGQAIILGAPRGHQRLLGNRESCCSSKKFRSFRFSAGVRLFDTQDKLLEASNPVGYPCPDKPTCNQDSDCSSKTLPFFLLFAVECLDRIPGKFFLLLVPSFLLFNKIHLPSGSCNHFLKYHFPSSSLIWER